jgi:transcriptional regulator of arginine metabolism
MSIGKMSLDQTILHLITLQPVPDQASLLRLLAQEGHRLTQGTLSRRLTKLSVQKREGRYQRVIPQDHPMPPYSLTEAPPNLLMLQTGPGLGMALGIRIDRSHVPGVAGTIAGEDTLLIAIARGYELTDVRGRVEKLLGPPQ